MEVTGLITHIAKAGETPDILAFKYYNNEFMASYIIEANSQYNNTIKFKGGEKIIIPVFDTVESDETLAPWRRN